MRTLWQIPYSPWSAKTRWALHHHRLAFERHNYRIMLDEPALRWKLRRVRGVVSVPVLFEGDRAIEGAWDIALHAEALGSGEPLFFDLEACAYFNRLGDEAMAVGRARGIRRMLDSDEAKEENLKGIVPKPLRKRMRPVATTAMKYLLAKYPAAPEHRFEEILTEFERVRDGNAFLVDDRLSYADLVLAALVDFLVPLKLRHRGKATEGLWGAPALVERFGALVEWRDGLVPLLQPDAAAPGETDR